MAIKPVVVTAVFDSTACAICGDGAKNKIDKLGALCEECLMEIIRQWNRGESAAVH